ncbi:MAG: hypothetical protein F9K28_11020 [Bacteroidetes bacterium]|nr:MAG: hypothetical protein F9K28_11020 [Bacteroidota bacterium]
MRFAELALFHLEFSLLASLTLLENSTFAWLNFRGAYKIIVDFGPGFNFTEVESILNARIRNSGGTKKLVVIDNSPDAVGLTFLFASDIAAGNLEYINGDFSNPNILSGRKAIEAFNIYPNSSAAGMTMDGKPVGPAPVALGFQYHVRQQGKVYMVTEVPSAFEKIYEELKGRGFGGGGNDYAHHQGVHGSDIAAGMNGPKIPFVSIHGAKSTVYDLYLTRQG